ncbi:activating signal cointegrator 1 complex subunit [Coemansia sp. BCRC 34490]|nr:activating signal cointegrator 1 complex subunit [Coemansia sp. BCRC 34490]
MRTAAYTHFISLPITSARVQGKVAEFQNIARGRSELEGMAESSLVKPSRMHITVGMLRLATEEDRRAAAGCLESLGSGVREILGRGGPLDVRVYGVATMERDAREARILYAKVEDAGAGGDRLRRVCEYVRDAFGSAGLIDCGEMQRELKLHMTVVRASGTSPVANGGEGRRARSRRRFTVDARALVEEFGQAPFGTCRIGQIQIARRFHFTEDGAYANDGILELP